MMARVVMLAMCRDGLITLPPPKWGQNRPEPVVFGPGDEPPLLPPADPYAVLTITPPFEANKKTAEREL